VNFINTYLRDAMSLDRTEGSHPLAGEYANPHDPVLFHDHINYCKGPVMMRMMEDVMGADVMQKGLQQCLRDHYMGKINWDQIVETLEKQAPGAGVRQFSDVWVKQKGMPVITCTYQNGNVVVKQSDPYGRGLCWRQKFEMKVISNLGKSQIIKVDMLQPTMTFKYSGGAPAFIVPNQDGRGYGRFTLDDHYVQTLPTRLIITRNDLNRYTLLNLIHDNYLQGKLTPSHFGELFRFLGREKNPLIMETAINQMHKIASDLTLQQRYTLELVIMDLLGENRTKECRQLVLRKLGTSAISPEVLDKLQTILDRHNEDVLDEHDYMEIAYRLAIIRPDRRQAILDKERDRIISSGNDELRQEFDFVSKATHPIASAREEVFKDLLKAENRVNETWALNALRLLNSDVFEPQSNVYLVEGLKALPEIQKTNSLAFPGRWTRALISNHRSAEAKTEIQKFLAESTDYPANLKNYVYESAWVLMNQIPYVDKTPRPATTTTTTKKTTKRR
jgi:aminopeptidase N